MENQKTKIARWLSGLAIGIIMIVFLWQYLIDANIFSSDDDNTADRTEIVSQSNKGETRPEPEQPDDSTKFTQQTVTRKYIRTLSAVSLHKKDSETSDRIAVIEAGTEAELIIESDSHYQVRTDDNSTGWLLKSSCEVFDKKVTVTHIPRKVPGEPVQIAGTEEARNMVSILKRHNTVGASIALIRDGKVSYHMEYGFADKEKNDPVNVDTKFRIASVSKIVTTMLAMTEVDDDKLDLDADLSKLFGFKFRNPAYPKTAVTMRMLMTHSSGLHDVDKMYAYSLRRVASGSEFYTSQPGTSFLYSNLNFGIAGAVIEKTSGESISLYAKEKFFDPMGIDASYNAKYLSDKSLVANCYLAGKLERDNKTLTRDTDKGAPGEYFQLGQGGVLISSVDLAKLFTLLLNEGTYEGKRYLSLSSVNEMLSVQGIATKKDFQQCLGIRLYPHLIGERNLYYHNGSSYGIFALMAIDPSDNTGVIVITSGAYSGRKANTIFEVCDEILTYCYEDIF